MAGELTRGQVSWGGQLGVRGGARCSQRSLDMQKPWEDCAHVLDTMERSLVHHTRGAGYPKSSFMRSTVGFALLLGARGHDPDLRAVVADLAAQKCCLMLRRDLLCPRLCPMHGTDVEMHALPRLQPSPAVSVGHHRAALSTTAPCWEGSTQLRSIW